MQTVLVFATERYVPDMKDRVVVNGWRLLVLHGDKNITSIQDPFELAHNTAKAVSTQSMRIIMESLRNELA